MGERGYEYTSNAGIRLSTFEALISTKRRVVLAYSRFVAILRRKKDFYQFLMESAKRTTPRKLHRKAVQSSHGENRGHEKIAFRDNSKNCERIETRKEGKWKAL